MELERVPRKERNISSLIYCATCLFFGSISGLPIFTTVPPSIATPVQGSTFHVTCQAEGYPRPEINWTRAAMPLHAGRTSINQGTFTINNLSPDDSGFYECVATNIMGTKKTRINVAVQVRRLGLYCRHRIYLIQSKVALRVGHWPNWPWAFGHMKLTAMTCL